MFDATGCMADGGDETCESSATWLVAYKGGDIVRDMLSAMGVFRVDLGTLGCPKTDVVLACAERAGRLQSRCARCARTRSSTNSSGQILHCSRVEVCAMADWVSQKIKY